MRTTKDLLNNLWVRPCSYGEYYVQMYYRNQVYSCRTNNTLAIDRIHSKDEVEDHKNLYGYTLKQAYMSLYDECKAHNDL